MELVHCKELLQVNLPSVFGPLDLKEPVWVIVIWIMMTHGNKKPLK